MKTVFLFAGILFISAIFASTSMAREVTTMGNFRISSPAFQQDGQIPSKYTCDGEDINPPLRIENVPPSTKSLAMIVEDPDAPAKTWIHWVLWNISPSTSEISEDSVPKDAGQGMNDFRKNNYGGPCPPSGTHRYFFKLYALDILLDLPSGATKPDLEGAMKGHILGQTELMGLYKRR